MSALELSSNLGDTHRKKSPVSVLLASVHVTSIIAAGCNITHATFNPWSFTTSECTDHAGGGLGRFRMR